MSPRSGKVWKFPIYGTDPISKGSFILEWFAIRYSYYEDGSYDPYIEAKITILEDNNKFYANLKKAPLSIYEHPLSILFPDATRFAKVTNMTKWCENENAYEGNNIQMEVVLKFTDNLGYFESITTFKDENNI